jgi:hypothetical protein
VGSFDVTVSVFSGPIYVVAGVVMTAAGMDVEVLEAS